MKIDRKATTYQWGNGRFDCMTDEEVRTLTAGEMEALAWRLAETMRSGETPIGEELYHHILELHLRYPDNDFLLTALPPPDQDAS